jgi:hypothetical protein
MMVSKRLIAISLIEEAQGYHVCRPARSICGKHGIHAVKIRQAITPTRAVDALCTHNMQFGFECCVEEQVRPARY